MKLWKRLAAGLLAAVMAVSAVPASAIIAGAETLETANVEVDYLASGKTVAIAGEKYETTITELSLSDKKLTETDLKNIGKLKKLKTLWLTSCELKSLSFLKNLTKLEDLGLFWNSEITSLSPLKNLKKLKTLNLNKTGVKSLSSLKNLTNLKKLSVVEENISNLAPLKKLTKLEELYLETPSVTDASSIKYLTNLKSLTLFGNNLSKFPSLKKLTKLEELHLYNLSLADMSPLSNLNGLKVLTFAYACKISDLSFLKKLGNMEELVFECPIDCSDFSALADMKHLKSLRICVKDLDHFDTSSLKLLSSLENLRFVDYDGFIGASITVDFVETVRKALPNCSVNGQTYGGRGF